ncbi:sensor histidine kinase [Arcticibacter tournemirensis]
MKLFTIYNRMLLVVLFGGFITVGAFFYQALTYILNSTIDEGLNEELMEVREFMHSRNHAPAPKGDKNLIITFENIPNATDYKEIKDTVFFNPKKRVTESGRYLKADIVFEGRPLRVLIINSKLPQQKQFQLIFFAILIPVLILFAVLIYINHYILKKMWQPFRHILSQIKTFNLNKESKYINVNSSVDEFTELDESVSAMITKIGEDFREIKLFTENASHEMMTPIAVINSKLDNILQSNTLREEDSQSLQDLYIAISKLNKISHSLLLLVKIEHDLLTGAEELSVNEMILQKAEYFRELIFERHLHLTIETANTTIKTSRYLFDILLNNLFSNAIRHNIDSGKINVLLKDGKLIFENTGQLGPLQEDKVFERFYKTAGSEGIGLGLAIIKQICNKQNFDLKYEYRAPFHSFIINLN